MPIATDRSAQKISKVWFLDYIKDAFSNKLSLLVQFITALNNFQYGDLIKRFKIFKILKF